MTESSPASRPWIPLLSEILALGVAGIAVLHGDLQLGVAGLLALAAATAARVLALRSGAIEAVRGPEAAVTLAFALIVSLPAAFQASGRLLPGALLASSAAGFVAGASRQLRLLKKRLAGVTVEEITPFRIDSLLALDTIVLNKTGTLTFGRLEVTRTSPMAGISEEELLEAAVVALTPRQDDPVARSVLEVAAARGIAAPPESKGNCLAGSREDLEAADIRLPKAGYAREGTTVWVARGGRCTGSFAVDDVLRPEVRHAIALFHGMKLTTVMLSEDDISSTRYVGWRSSVSASHGNLSAADRRAKVEELRRAGRRVAVIADAASDPALLAAADVAIFMGSPAAGANAGLTLRERNLLTLAEAFGAMRTFRFKTRLWAAAALVAGVLGGRLVLEQQFSPIFGAVWGILASGLLLLVGGLRRS